MITMIMASPIVNSLLSGQKAFALCVRPTKLDGTMWHGTGDGGTYYMRQIGNDVYWMAENTANGYNDGWVWTNVFKGTVDASGNTITGNVADVPHGKNLFTSTISFQIVRDSSGGIQSLKLISGAYGTTTWSGICNDVVDTPVGGSNTPSDIPCSFLLPSYHPSTLTAFWHGTGDGGTYYSRQVGLDVYWMAESSDNGKTWTNVFKGTIDSSGNFITGTFVDVPHGHNRYSGQLTFQILRDSSGNIQSLKLVYASAGYGTNTLTGESCFMHL